MADITAPSATPASSTDRPGTTFEAVGDTPEQHDGAKLMVTAYSVIWVILMVWVFLMWEKSRSLHARVDELDKAIDRAATKANAAEKARAADKPSETKQEQQEKNEKIEEKVTAEPT